MHAPLNLKHPISANEIDMKKYSVHVKTIKKKTIVKL